MHYELLASSLQYQGVLLPRGFGSEAFAESQGVHFHALISDSFFSSLYRIISLFITHQ